MAVQEFVRELLEQPGGEAQRRFLAAHASLLDDGLADALKQQASQLLRLDVQRSSQMAALLLYLGELTGDPCHRALGLLAEANICCLGGRGEYGRACELYDEAAAIYRESNRPLDHAISQIGKLCALAFLGRYEEALETGKWVSRVLEEHGQWRRLATATLNLGLIHGRMGEDAQALELFDRSRELYRRLGEEGEAFVPWADQNRAIVLRNLGQYDASLEASRAAWEALDRLGQTAEAARAQQNLALTYFVLGRTNEALVHLDRVREVFLADGRSRDAILVELFITDCLLELRRFTEVLEKCRRIRERFAGLGTRFEVAEALLNEAVAHAGLRRYTDALASLADARQRFTEEGNQVWVACADLEMAAVLLERRQFEEGLAATRACSEVFRTHGLPVRLAQAELVAARGLIALDRAGEAHPLLDQVLDVATRRDVPSLAYQAQHLKGELAAAAGDREEALWACDRAMRQLERLRGRLMVEHRTGFLEDKQAVYADAVLLSIDTGHPVRALEYAERAKSRALLDLLTYRVDLSVQARSDADRPLVDELLRLRAERDTLYRRWEGREESIEEGWGADDERRGHARQQVLALEGQITELWHRLLVHNAGYAQDASLWQVRAEPVQPYLPPDTALLEYFVAHDRVVAFVVTGATVQAHSLPGTLAEIERLIQLFWVNLKSARGCSPAQVASLASNAEGLLRRLHDLLIEPLGEAMAPYPRWIVVPHGSLHYLPFHALHDGNSCLLERQEISYLPGASLLRYCQAAQVEKSGLLALGHSCDGRLPHAPDEARRVGRLLGHRVYVEEEATVARLRAAAGDCRAIHLATHGEFRPDNPLFSGLLFADGWLTTFDIFNLRLNASLVVLSACQTGRSVIGGGDELLGLMRALLYAGAASVVLSLWAVEDRSTADLMTAFYGKLAEGWTKGAALRHAQQQFLSRPGAGEGSMRKAYLHPYYWAPFCLVGDAGRL